MDDFTRFQVYKLLIESPFVSPPSPPNQITKEYRAEPLVVLVPPLAPPDAPVLPVEPLRRPLLLPPPLRFQGLHSLLKELLNQGAAAGSGGWRGCL